MEAKIKKIIVTGSSGTVGTALCEKLAEEGFEVVCADSKPNKWNAEINGKTVIADLCSRKEIDEKLPKDADLIIHLAANARVYDLVVKPELALDNFTMLFNMLEFARQNNIKKFMFSSSREVYGNSERIVHGEADVDIERCESPYSATKMGGEALVHAYGKCYGVDYIIFRFSNVYGKYDDSDRVVPLFIRLSRQGKDLTVFGKDKMLDFTYIDDTINGIVLAIKKFDETKNNVFNLAYGEGTTILKVAELIEKEMGANGKIIIKESRTGEVIKYIADISKARKILGYEPKVGVEEGIRRSVEWYIENT